MRIQGGEQSMECSGYSGGMMPLDKPHIVNDFNIFTLRHYADCCCNSVFGAKYYGVCYRFIRGGRI